MRLARLLSARPNTKVVSIFRNAAHSEEVAATGATPLVLSLEDAPKARFVEVFEGKDLVYFSAGAGGKGDPSRTRKVDYDGALKVFDAIEEVKGTKPRLIMVSGLDIRDTSVPPPAHYVRQFSLNRLSVTHEGRVRLRTISRCPRAGKRLSDSTCKRSSTQTRTSPLALRSSGRFSVLGLSRMSPALGARL